MREIQVRLTWPEVMQAAQAGVMRQISSLKNGDIDKHGYDGAGWDTHIMGALGEMAFCKAFGVYWTPTVNTFKAADVGTDIEVKARLRDDWEMIVRPDDHFERLFVLVTGHPPLLTVRGWKLGTDCRREEWWKDHGKRPYAWFVPQSALNDIDQLPFRRERRFAITIAPKDATDAARIAAQMGGLLERGLP